MGRGANFRSAMIAGDYPLKLLRLTADSQITYE
jgi:hypothetical protein